MAEARAEIARLVMLNEQRVDEIARLTTEAWEDSRTLDWLIPELRKIPNNLAERWPAGRPPDFWGGVRVYREAVEALLERKPPTHASPA